MFTEEVERSGQMTGDVLDAAWGRVNDWAEKYVQKQREFGVKVKKTTMKRKASSMAGAAKISFHQEVSQFCWPPATGLHRYAAILLSTH